MQKYLSILFCILLLQISSAQHLVKKEIDYNNKPIEIICRDIDHLKLESFKGNKVKVDMQDFDGQYTNIDIIKQNGKLLIKQKETLPQTDIVNKFCVEQPLFATYFIKVPNGSQVYLKIISGNLMVQDFKGQLNTDMGTGSVILSQNTGILNLKIIDGSVKALIKNTELNLSTNMGSIESNLKKLQPTNNNKLLKGVYKNDKNKLIIKAVKANIYLAAAKN